MGALLGMAVEGDRGRWWGGAYKVVVAAGLCVGQREVGGRLGPECPKPSRYGLCLGWVWAASGHAGSYGLTAPPVVVT